MDWTFGIVTSENTGVYINAVIDSILAQKLRNFEIIVVGGKPLHRGEIHVPFDENIKTGWITRKKNLIATIARYDNAVITHDYVEFLPLWGQHFESFGDNWDVCMNRILNTDNKRFRDWVSYDAEDTTRDWIPPEFIPYSDSSRIKKMYVSGSYFCVKKSFLIKHPFDERLCWGQSEDCEWSCRIRNSWNYRCNPNSVVRFLKEKPHFPPTIE